MPTVFQVNNMAQLEKTIKQILAERTCATERKDTQSEAELIAEENALHYTAEFNKQYCVIHGIRQMEREFIAWANQCTIDDGRNEIKDGAGVYNNLLQEAHAAYRQFREQGYEQPTAFDKATTGLASWMHDAAHQKSGGTIFLNHSPQFLSRMRKLADW